MKLLLDKLINKLGYNITKNRATPKDNPFNVLILLLSRYVATHPSFFFVQVGANDGLRWDPLQNFVKKNSLSGLLIEPLPDLFDELKSNYADSGNLLFANCAVHRKDGEQVMYRAKRDAPVPDWAHGIASFNENHVLQSVPSEDVESITVQTKSPKTLLKEYEVEKIDFLQIDTEGFDYEIIKLFFLSGVFPNIINYENINLSGEDRTECKNYLFTNGYKYLDVGIDVLVLHESAVRELSI